MRRNRSFSFFCVLLSIAFFLAGFLATAACAADSGLPASTAVGGTSTRADESALAMTRTDVLPAGVVRDEDLELRRADLVLMQAIAANDPIAAANLLAPEFAWIDRDGRSRRKSELVSRLILLEAGADANVAIERFGRVAIITGSHRLSPDDATALFIRVWIHQPAGWRLFLYQETTPAGFSMKDTRYSLPHREWRNCQNPCRELPFKALSPEAQEIIAAFMAGEQAVFDGDAQTADRILADDCLLVTPKSAQPMDKAERIAALRRNANGTQMTPPPVVVSLALRVFGTAAVMSADEISASGEKLRDTRVWARRDGQWQLAFSQQTLVQ